jgi:hypothetical protein
MREVGERLRHQAIDMIAKAQAEIARLESIKPFLAPDAPGKLKGADATGMEDEGATRERERLLDQQAQAEAQRIVERIGRQTEVYAEELGLEETFQAEKVAREKAHIEAMQKMRIEAADWEQEQLTKQGQEELAILEAIAKAEEDRRRQQIEDFKKFWGNLTGLMNTGSKKMFEIGKAASLAQAGYKGATAVMSAWDAGMSVGGPWAPVVAAAYAAAAGLNAINLMNNIRSQQFGGGGGAPVAPTQGASNVSPVGAGGASGQRERPIAHTTVVLPATDLTSTSAVRQMLLGLQEEISANGGSLTVR